MVRDSSVREGRASERKTQDEHITHEEKRREIDKKEENERRRENVVKGAQKYGHARPPAGEERKPGKKESRAISMMT